MNIRFEAKKKESSPIRNYLLQQRKKKQINNSNEYKLKDFLL